MKKLLLLLVSMLLLFSLCACSGANEPYTVEIGWRTFEIDPEACTISHKEDTYQYDISEEISSYTVTITYPDGSTYYETHREHNSGQTSITSGHSADYDQYRYDDGALLCEALEDELPGSFFTGDPGVGFFIILLGIFFIMLPRIAWWLKIGWLVKDVEPSTFSLIVFRIFGVLLILAGILKCFIP